MNHRSIFEFIIRKAELCCAGFFDTWTIEMLIISLILLEIEFLIVIDNIDYG